jgi:hypothetical protein
VKLADAQREIARGLGSASWPQLVGRVEAEAVRREERHATFVDWAIDRPADLAEELLAVEPELARSGLDAALVAGDSEFVGAALERDAGLVGRELGHRSWLPLVYVCHSRLLQGSRSDGLLACAELLLERGTEQEGHDWPELEGTIRWSLGRERSREHIDLLLAHGAPVEPGDATLAVRRGRPELLELLGAPSPSASDELIGAIRRADPSGAQAVIAANPGLLQSLGRADHDVLARGRLVRVRRGRGAAAGRGCGPERRGGTAVPRPAPRLDDPWLATCGPQRAGKVGNGR